MRTAPSDMADDLLRRTLRGGRLLRALSELRTRHPSASFEVGAVEHAIADATREIEAYLGQVGAPPALPPR